MSKPETARRMEFFENVVLSYSSDDCLIWPFYRNSLGYGMLTIAGRRVLASREACLRVHGNPGPQQTDAAHSCGNGHLGCVNPRHLRWSTRRENCADAVLHGTNNRGERCGTSKLTEAQVREILSLKGLVTQSELANRYSVHQVTISKILNRIRWSHLHGAEV